jgi:hypothetical protein
VGRVRGVQGAWGEMPAVGGVVPESLAAAAVPAAVAAAGLDAVGPCTKASAGSMSRVLEVTVASQCCCVCCCGLMRSF